MAYTLRDGQGSIFLNDEKLSDKHPTHTGKLMVGGKLHWVSMWERQGASGKPWFSLEVKEAVKKPANEATAKVDKAHEAKGGGFAPDTDIPFAKRHHRDS